MREKESSIDDLLVERKQHNIKKAQLMTKPLVVKNYWLCFFRGKVMRLIRLSQKFYDEYSECEEILRKPSRPYVCVTLSVDGVLFAVPFRHHITHQYSFITYDEYGLDYSKAVVVPDSSYISKDRPQIEQKEYNIIKKNEEKIKTELSKYIKLYKKARIFNTSIHYRNILKCTSLKYFDEYL